MGKLKKALSAGQTAMFVKTSIVEYHGRLFEFKEGTNVCYDEFNNLYLNSVLVPISIFEPLKKAIGDFVVTMNFMMPRYMVVYGIQKQEVEEEGFSVYVPVEIRKEITDPEQADKEFKALLIAGNYAARKYAAKKCHELNREIFQSQMKK